MNLRPSDYKLVCRVSHTGNKSFLVTKRVNGKLKNVTIGKFIDVTVIDARKKAQDILVKLNIGIDYRSKVNMKVENGDTKFTEIPSSMSEVFPATGNFDAELPLPANLDIGLAYQFSDKFTLAVEVNMIFWSVYDSLIIDFKENNETLVDSRNPREYSNSFIPRIGAEYKFSDVFIGRVGVYYDKTPTNADYFSPETVSLDQVAFTLGLSIMPVEGLSIDLSYLQLEGLESDKQYLPDNFKGTYTTRAFIPGIGVSYNF